MNVCVFVKRMSAPVVVVVVVVAVDIFPVVVVQVGQGGESLARTQVFASALCQEAEIFYRSFLTEYSLPISFLI